MKIQQLPIFNDNYAYLLIDEAAGVCAAVDPAEPAPVLAAIEKSGARLTHVLSTHHHFDHTAGNEAMLAAHPNAVVVGPAAEAQKIPGISVEVKEGDTVTVGNLKGRVLATPCHTSGHIAYLFGDALFCGDTLFVGGCGRFFEGSAAEMHHALNAIFAQLPPRTRVYCGHEYTVSNLRFALSVEPDNAALQEKMAWAQKRREADAFTVPSTIGEELTYNPFMRVHEPTIQAFTGESDPVKVMAALREAKNGF